MYTVRLFRRMIPHNNNSTSPPTPPHIRVRTAYTLFYLIAWEVPLVAVTPSRCYVKYFESPASKGHSMALKYPKTVKETCSRLWTPPSPSPFRVPRMPAGLQTVSPGVSTQPSAAAVPTDVIQMLGIKTNASTVLAKTFFILIILLIITMRHILP